MLAIAIRSLLYAVQLMHMQSNSYNVLHKTVQVQITITLHIHIQKAYKKAQNI